MKKIGFLGVIALFALVSAGFASALPIGCTGTGTSFAWDYDSAYSLALWGAVNQADGNCHEQGYAYCQIPGTSWCTIDESWYYNNEYVEGYAGKCVFTSTCVGVY